MTDRDEAIKRLFKHGRCGAYTHGRRSKCRRAAMSNGRCALHGGKSLKGLEAPGFKDGKHSKYMKKDVLKRILDAKDDPNLKDLREELSILKGLLRSHIQVEENLLSKASINKITTLVDRIYKTVDTIKRVNEGYTFTVKNVNNVLIQMVKIINNRITDPVVKRQITVDLKSLSYSDVD